MQSKWIKKDSNDTLVLMFMGWACDEGMLESVNFEHCDMLSFFDYSGDLSKVEVEDYSKYKRVVLLAWSFGVWVSDFLFASGKLPRVDAAMAMNGTVTPIHKTHGIHPTNFRLTVKGLERVGLSKFYDKISTENPINQCTRDIKVQIDELKNLEQWSLHEYNSTLKWDLALIGYKDSIFNPKNMQNYWNSVGTQIINGESIEHYPFNKEGMGVINRFLDESK
ncbi:MAG: DUF452 family protein [Rikenellaceae bacterium]